MTRVRLPMRFPSSDMPEHVKITDVGPRDGLQNESTTVPTEVKAEFITRLEAAGLPVVEVTSLVRPDWVPQLADAEALIATLAATPDAARRNRPVLVPNERGLQRAIALELRDVAVFASATETFARRNLNRGLTESLSRITATVQHGVGAGLTVRGYISMCFGDPWEGPVDLAQVVSVGTALLDAGCFELSLGDTIGVATAGHVRALVEAFGASGVEPGTLAVHFHDTYGQALSNTLAALACGVRTVDASAGGLGGCPYAKSATGNLATEDLIWALDGLGIETGVDLDALVETSVWMAGILGRPSPSRVVNALGKR